MGVYRRASVGANDLMGVQFETIATQESCSPAEGMVEQDLAGSEGGLHAKAGAHLQGYLVHKKYIPPAPYGRGTPGDREKEIFIDNLLVRVHLIIEMSRPALRHGSLNFLYQVALYLPS